MGSISKYLSSCGLEFQQWVASTEVSIGEIVDRLQWMFIELMKQKQKTWIQNPLFFISNL